MTSKPEFSCLTFCAVVLAAVAVAAPAALAQGRPANAPRYDLKTEVTLNGSVEAVEPVTPAGSGRGWRGLGGTHITLRTESAEAVQVHLGPTAYLAEQQLAVQMGDRVRVVGSRITLDGDSVVIAREVTKGGRTWTLRDGSGLPLWRGGRGRGRQ